MNPLLKRVARAGYRLATCNPLARAVVRHELARLGANSWNAHHLDAFFRCPEGAVHGVGRAEKERLAEQFQAICGVIPSGTPPLAHVLLAREILAVPPETAGAVIECGVWKGASAASLSLVCRLAGRRLLVCDSFQGLPGGDTERHLGMHTRVYGHYKEGMFAGSLDEVRENIRRHGALEVCDFVEGLFADSLSALREPLVFAFLDVDLESSTRDCLRALWPLLIEDAALFSDDAGDLDVARVYFDTPWWQEALGCPAPGLVGAGCGLPLAPNGSSLGYTRKLGAFREADWKRADFLYYPEEEARE